MRHCNRFPGWPICHAAARRNACAQLFHRQFARGRDIEIHVRRISGGKMSGWLHDTAREGDKVQIQGPSGDWFYVPGSPDQPLLLAGTETGLAPLYGILRGALSRDHKGPRHLFHGAVHPGGLYLQGELQKLAARHSNVEYTPSVLRGSDDGIATGSIEKVLRERLPQLSGWRAFVCGDPEIVKLLRKTIFFGRGRIARYLCRCFRARGTNMMQCS